MLEEPSTEFPYEDVYTSLDAQPELPEIRLEQFESIIEWINQGRTAQACLVRIQAVRKYYCADSDSELARRAKVSRRRMTQAIELLASHLHVRAPGQWSKESRNGFARKIAMKKGNNLPRVEIEHHKRGMQAASMAHTNSNGE